MKTLITLVIAAMLSCTAFNAYSNNEETPSTAEQEQVQSQSINVNTADVTTLSTLKGIGKKKALAIIEYRDTYGGFISKDDLLNVQGIGKKILTDNASRIVL